MGKKNKFKARLVTVFGVIPAVLAFILTVLQLKDYFVDKDKIPSFVGDIYFNQPENHDFVEFLLASEGGIVYIDSQINSSLVLLAHHFVSDECGHKEDTLYGDIFNQYIGLPYLAESGFQSIPLTEFSEPVFDDVKETLHSKVDCGHYQLFIESKNASKLMSSHGGPGLIYLEWQGFYKVSMRQVGGPSIVFHLIEYDPPFEIRSKFLKKHNR